MKISSVSPPGGRVTTLILLILFAALISSGCANVAEIRRNQADAHYSMANSYLQQGRGIHDEVNRRKAYPELVKAIQLDSENAEFHMLLGMIYMYNEELVPAEKELKRAIDIDAELGEAHNNLGTLYMMEDRLSEAVVEFKRAIGNLAYQTPEFAYFNLGRASYRLGDYSQAGGAFEKVVEIMPGWSEAHFRLGRCYVKLGRMEDARESFARALDLEPESVRANFEMAVVLFKLNRKEAAAEHFAKVVEFDPDGDMAEQARTFIKLLK